MSDNGLSEHESGPAQDQAAAISSLPPNLAILKIENDTIQSLAAARPRDMQAIKKELETTLVAFPGLADEAIYSKPVGKVVDITCGCGHRYEAPVSKKKNERKEHDCPRCNFGNRAPADARPRQKFVRDLSIRAAETLAEAYGYNRTRADVTPQSDGSVKIEATFCDYQKGRIWQDSGIVSPWYTKWDGGRERISDDRFYNTTVKAEKSKLVREVINRSLNSGLKAWFFDRCDKLQNELLTEDKLNQIVSAFGEFCVTLSMLEELLGRPKSAGWTLADKRQLTGIYTGLKGGDMSVHEVFGASSVPKKEPTEEPSTGPVKADDLFNATREPGDEP